MNRLFLILLMVSALAAAACSDDAESSVQTERGLPEDLESVAAAVIEPDSAELDPVNGTGPYATTGEFISPSQSDVAPVIGGRVAAVHVDEGAVVRKGQPLASLEIDYFRLELKAAQAELERAAAAAAEASRELERKKELRAKESIPQSLHDRTLAAQEQAAAMLRGAEAAVAIAKQRLADAVIRSPLDGVVAERRVDVGEFVSDSGVAFVVIQTAPLKLRFMVPERFLGKIRRGDRVVAMVDPFPGERFEGTLTTVGGVIDPGSRTLFADAEFKNEDNRLRPGLFARIEADLAQ